MEVRFVLDGKDFHHLFNTCCVFYCCVIVPKSPNDVHFHVDITNNAYLNSFLESGEKKQQSSSGKMKSRTSTNKLQGAPSDGKREAKYA